MPDLSAIADDDLDFSDPEQLDEYLRRTMTSGPPATNFAEHYGAMSPRMEAPSAAAQAPPPPAAAARAPDPRAQQIGDELAAEATSAMSAGMPDIMSILGGGAAGGPPPPTEDELNELMLGTGQWPAGGRPRATTRR